MTSKAPKEGQKNLYVDNDELAQKQLWFSSYSIHIISFIINTENSHNNQF